MTCGGVGTLGQCTAGRLRDRRAQRLHGRPRPPPAGTTAPATAPAPAASGPPGPPAAWPPARARRCSRCPPATARGPASPARPAPAACTSAAPPARAARPAAPSTRTATTGSAAPGSASRSNSVTPVNLAGNGDLEYNATTGLVDERRRHAGGRDRRGPRPRRHVQPRRHRADRELHGAGLRAPDGGGEVQHHGLGHAEHRPDLRVGGDAARPQLRVAERFKLPRGRELRRLAPLRDVDEDHRNRRPHGDGRVRPVHDGRGGGLRGCSTSTRRGPSRRRPCPICSSTTWS